MLTNARAVQKRRKLAKPYTGFHAGGRAGPAKTAKKARPKGSAPKSRKGRLRPRALLAPSTSCPTKGSTTAFHSLATRKTAPAKAGDKANTSV